MAGGASARSDRFGDHAVTLFDSYWLAFIPSIPSIVAVDGGRS